MIGWRQNRKLNIYTGRNIKYSEGNFTERKDQTNKLTKNEYHVLGMVEAIAEDGFSLLPFGLGAP